MRQVSFFRGKRDGVESHSERMKRRIDSTQGNLRHNKRLTRFTLRGQEKIDGQWKLFCLVHNIEQLGHHGYAH